MIWAGKEYIVCKVHRACGQQSEDRSETDRHGDGQSPAAAALSLLLRLHVANPSAESIEDVAATRCRGNAVPADRPFRVL